MVKTTNILKNRLRPSTYKNLIELYKAILMEGNKEKLYFFKGLVYLAFFPNGEAKWREPDDFLGEMCVNNHFDIYFRYKETNWFGSPISEGIKKIL